MKFVSPKQYLPSVHLRSIRLRKRLVLRYYLPPQAYRIGKHALPHQQGHPVKTANLTLVSRDAAAPVHLNSKDLWAFGIQTVWHFGQAECGRVLAVIILADRMGKTIEQSGGRAEN
ncbi:uncharacterized protein EAF01_003210 [Botrytis porri]|uniref:uncharacterized protein n=1 Tax=Botrytis porri TaxID=87229 RepID=UPI001900E5A0|nr:uncharacterized protein EAF01_003210 [Botrytis porri]KAF7909492.1 hypothetical protein EAF01_003210 [Botrytis porri]